MLNINKEQSSECTHLYTRMMLQSVDEKRELEIDHCVVTQNSRERKKHLPPFIFFGIRLQGFLDFLDLVSYMQSNGSC